MTPEQFENNFKVPRETIHRLTRYGQMLEEWNGRFNLVAESTLPNIWARHFADSAQLMEYIPQQTRIIADMGAGAGFPGLVLAIMAKDSERNLHINAIESTGKKADFLQAVTDDLQLPVIVHRTRIESLRDLKADIITARALKALPELLKYANYLTKPDSLCLFLKGKSLDEELTEARKYWTFDFNCHPSLTDDSGRILALQSLRYKTRR